MIHIKRLLLLFLFTFLTANISWAEIRKEREEVIIARFDKDLLEYLDGPSSETGKVLIQKYSIFLPAFAQTIVRNEQNNTLDELSRYFSHPTLKNLYRNAVAQYNDMSSYEHELSAMLKIAQSELATKRFPNFSVHVSGYRQNVIYINNAISLSIDKYLGLDYSGYKGFFDGYQLYQMQPKMLVRDFTKAWLIADFIKAEKQSPNLLSKMIEEGKLLYALSVLLPDYTENDIIGTTSAEVQKAEDNEDRVWKTIIKGKQLYATDLQIISSYFDEVPKKLSLGEQPMRMGAWIGYQIVKQYSKNSKQSLSTILRTEPQTILKEAKYKP